MGKIKNAKSKKIAKVHKDHKKNLQKISVTKVKKLRRKKRKRKISRVHKSEQKKGKVQFNIGCVVTNRKGTKEQFKMDGDTLNALQRRTKLLDKGIMNFIEGLSKNRDVEVNTNKIVILKK